MSVGRNGNERSGTRTWPQQQGDALVVCRDDDELRERMGTLCEATAPRVFAICAEEDPDEEAGDPDNEPVAARIVAWGLDFGASTVLATPDGCMLGETASPESARNSLCRHMYTWLVKPGTAPAPARH